MVSEGNLLAAATRRKAWLRAFFVLRVVALFLTVELSGSLHTFLDVCGVAEAAQDDCDDEAAGHECPPGCPSCHCAHAGAPSTPLRMTRDVQVVPLPVVRVGFAPRLEMEAHGADLESVYRPPRTRVLA